MENPEALEAIYNIWAIFKTAVTVFLIAVGFCILLKYSAIWLGYSNENDKRSLLQRIKEKMLS